MGKNVQGSFQQINAKQNKMNKLSDMTKLSLNTSLQEQRAGKANNEI